MDPAVQALLDDLRRGLQDLRTELRAELVASRDERGALRDRVTRLEVRLGEASPWNGWKESAKVWAPIVLALIALATALAKVGVGS